MSSFEEYYYKNIGKKIRQYRLKLNYTQEGLSQLLGLNEKYIGHVERFERRISNKILASLLDTLKIQPSDFFDFEDKYDFNIKPKP